MKAGPCVYLCDGWRPGPEACRHVSRCPRRGRFRLVKMTTTAKTTTPSTVRDGDSYRGGKRVRRCDGSARPRSFYVRPCVCANRARSVVVVSGCAAGGRLGARYHRVTAVAPCPERGRCAALAVPAPVPVRPQRRCLVRLRRVPPVISNDPCCLFESPCTRARVCVLSRVLHSRMCAKIIQPDHPVLRFWKIRITFDSIVLLMIALSSIQLGVEGPPGSLSGNPTLTAAVSVSVQPVSVGMPPPPSHTYTPPQPCCCLSGNRRCRERAY